MIVVNRRHSRRWTRCQRLGLLVIAILFHGSIVGPLIPLLRVTRLREVVVIGVVEGRGRVLARLLGVLPPACLAIDAGTGSVILCLSAAAQSILLQFDSLGLRCFRSNGVDWQRRLMLRRDRAVCICCVDGHVVGSVEGCALRTTRLLVRRVALVGRGLMWMLR